MQQTPRQGCRVRLYFVTLILCSLALQRKGKMAYLSKETVERYLDSDRGFEHRYLVPGDDLSAS